MKGFVVRAPEDCPIGPNDIDGSRHFFDAFGDSDTEDAAAYIVKFCQKRGMWVGFTLEEVREEFVPNIDFSGLISTHRLVERDGAFYITTSFAAACYESSPDGRGKLEPA